MRRGTCCRISSGTAIDAEYIGINPGSDLSQTDWPAEQAMGANISRIRQLLATGHKPSKRQTVRST